jgi:hypothetical protein
VTSHLIQQETIVMKTMQHCMFTFKVLAAALLAAIAVSMTAYAPTVAAHDNAGAWAAGGLLAGHMLTRAHMRREAAVYNAGEMQGANASAQPAAAASTAMTPEQKLSQLNKLAAGGYITPAEYKAKKQAILNTL